MDNRYVSHQQEPKPCFKTEVKRCTQRSRIDRYERSYMVFLNVLIDDENLNCLMNNLEKRTMCTLWNRGRDG